MKNALAALAAATLALSSITGGFLSIQNNRDGESGSSGVAGTEYSDSESVDFLGGSGVTPLPQTNAVYSRPQPSGPLLPPLLTAEEIEKAAEPPKPTSVADPLTPRPVVPTPSEAPEREDTGEEEPGPVDTGLDDFLFVGDSIAVGFHEHMNAEENQFYGRIGAGSGAIVDEVVPLLAKLLRDRDFMVVALGTNDSLGYEQVFSENVSRLIAEAKKGGVCSVWLTIHRYEGNANWDSYNAVLRNLDKEEGNLVLVDWAEMAANNPDYLYNDGIHIRPSGYEALWGEVLKASSKCSA